LIRATSVGSVFLLKRFIELLVCCLGLVCIGPPVAALSASLSLPRVQAAGRDWRDLASWAKANRLSFSWNRPAKAVYLTNASLG
jgi:hypothetical protein